MSTLASRAADASEEAIDSVRSGAAKVADAFGGDTGERIKDATHKAAAAGSEMAAAAGQQAKTLMGELEHAARKNPLMALGGALLVGVVLTLLTRRSD